MVNWSKFSGISPEQARKELAEIAKRMNQQIPQPVKKSNNSRTYKKHFEKIIFAEQYLNGIKKNHPNSEIINIPPGERGEYTFMIKDSMEQLAMIGITQDGYKFEDPKEIEKAIKEVEKSGHPNMQYLMSLKRALELAKQERRATQDSEDPDKKFNAFIQKYGWPTNYEESKALLEKAKKEGIHPDYIYGMERGLKAITHKDDDATEHGSIETYGKEKETETMPLEKNPTQAQDAVQAGSHVKVKNHGTGELVDLKVLKDNGDGTLEVKAPTGAVITIKESWIVKDEEPTDVKDANYSSWSKNDLYPQLASLEDLVASLKEDLRSGEYDGTVPGLKNPESVKSLIRNKEREIQEIKNRIKNQKDEAPASVKDTKADGDPETMTTQEAREYWNKYHNSDPILEDYPSFEAWYRESKRNGYIVDHVQDSYEMLKLCGIIS